MSIYTSPFLLLPPWPLIYQCRAMSSPAVLFDHGFRGYEKILDGSETGGEENGSWRTVSRRKRGGPYSMMASLSYRQERAKKRQIFLQSYKLAAVEMGSGSDCKGRYSCKLIKRVMVKLKAVAVSIVSVSRIGSLKSSCNSPSAICASTPTSVVNPLAACGYGTVWPKRK